MKKLVVLLLMLLFGAPLRGDTPQSVVREFYDAYRAGNVRKASEFWDASAAQSFITDADRLFRVRCVTHHDVTIAAPAIDGETATVDAEALLTLSSEMPGTRPRTETRFTTFELKRGDRWKITRWIDREALLADRVLAMSPVERTAVIEGAGRLRTPRLARELDRVAAGCLLRNDFTSGDALIALARGIAIETGDDVALSDVIATETMAIYRGPAGERHHSLATGKESVAVAERSGDPDAIARALRSLGIAEYTIDHRSCQPAFERILAMSEFLASPTELATAMSYLGYVANTDMDLTGQLRYGMSAITHAEMSGDPLELFQAYKVVGEAYQAMGYYELAVHYFSRSIEYGHACGFLDGVAKTMSYMATSYADLGRENEARQLLERAIAFARPEMKSLALENLASRSLQKGDLDDAAKRIEEAVQCDLAAGRESAVTLMALSEVRFRQGRWTEALDIAHSAMRAGAGLHLDADFDTGLQTLTLLRRMKRFDDARACIPMLRQLESRISSRGFDEWSWDQYFSRTSELDGEVIALEADSGDARAALRLANESTGRTLRAMAERKAPLPSQLMTGEEQAQTKALEEKIVELNRQLLNSGVSPSRAEEIRARLDRAHDDLDDARARAAATHSAGIPTLATTDDPLALAPDEAVIHFIQTSHDLIIVGVGPGRGADRRLIAVRRDILPQAMGDEVDALLQLLAKRDLRYGDASRRMYELLLEPMHPLFDRGHRVCIIPDGALWRLPFHALRTPDGKYLAETTTVFYAPAMALADLDAIHRRSQRRGDVSLVAFANPHLHVRSIAKYRSAFTGADIGRLPDTENEVREIANLYGPGSRVYVGGSATEAMLKSEMVHARVIHIATHGAVDRASPLASAMLLAPGSRDEDGVIEAREILELEMHADLAILATCNSAGEKTTPAEGVVGLAWAFLANGCPTTVVSQWNATSSVTSTMMIAFHRHLRAGNSAALALRQAQNEIRRDPRYRHPYYWAPFVVVGAQ